MTVFVARAGEEVGSYAEVEFRCKVRSGEISPSDNYWKKGMAEWEEVSKYPMPPATTKIIRRLHRTTPTEERPANRWEIIRRMRALWSQG